jgi:hypothetical protein
MPIVCGVAAGREYTVFAVRMIGMGEKKFVKKVGVECGMKSE